MEKISKNAALLIILGFIFVCGYILNLGAYPLLDLDETRYATMARDMLNTKEFMTLYLNGDYFFEKPPLYFWMVCLSFKLLGVSEWSARLPLVLISLLPLGLVFGLSNKIKGFKFGFIISCILLTSLEYMLITKISILDGALASFCSASILSYFYTFFVDRKNKKWFWILTYIFMGLAVLAKGMPGLAIPALIIAVSTIIFKTYKETFKYSVIGIPLFLLIALPWHILMLKTHPIVFFQEYIYKHHILRFLGSDVIHRNEPWYFYLLTVFWGLTPHTLMLLGLKNIKLDKFLKLNIIAAFTILVFFSLSGAKLITYILPVYPFLAAIIAQIWTCYIQKNDNILKYTILTVNSALVAGAILFPFVAACLLKENALDTRLMQVVLTVVSFYLIKSILCNERFNSFILQCLFFALLAGFCTPLGYKIDYSFGQEDLMKFAKFAKENNYTISTYMTGQKYCLSYYSGLKYIEFKRDEDIEWLNSELNKKNNIVIAKNNKIDNLPVKIKEKGIKYSIIEKKL